ncbi:MAG: methionyl-tRNA formyltransferase [Oscillospiraceae bacterium]|nr:methionyl-tRNA formyltransferase [Oscillospiraceae bacterium]
MRIVFMGTPSFAVPSLERLIADGHEICGVFTQPDKPQNRGMKLTPSPVKKAALACGIPVFQPVTLKTGEVLEQLQALKPDLIAVAAYGKLLPQSILDLPRLGCINVHSSLLPKYRGAAPIHWAILNGEAETGVTIMHMAAGLDTGDMILSQSTPIDPDETVEQLHDRLAQIGAGLLSQAVEQLEAGTARRVPQDGSLSCYAPMLSRELSPVDWSRSAREIHNQVRGLIPWPAAATELGGVKFKLFSVSETGEETKLPPGTVIRTDKKGIYTACGDGKVLRIDELQAEGGKRMGAADYLRGHPMTF